MKYLMTTAAFLALILAMHGADLPVFRDAQSSVAFRDKTPRVFRGDLSKKDKGVIIEKELKLPAGRYRLHYSVAAAPINTLAVGAVDLHVKAGGSSMVLPLQVLGENDDFLPRHLDFVPTGRDKTTPISFTWQVRSMKLDKNLASKRALEMRRLVKTKDTGEGMGLGDDDEDLDMDLDLDVDAGELLSMKQAKTTPVRVLINGAHLERLSPIEVVEVWPAKIVFGTKDVVSAKVSLRNHSRKSLPATVRLALASGLDRGRELTKLSLSLPPGKPVIRNFKDLMPARELRWGADLVVTVTTPGNPDAVGRGVFCVTDNFWDVHQYSFQGALADFSDPDRARQHALKMRRKGYTTLEALFWAPCDMFDYTPETEDFFGCQGAYPGTISGTKNIVQALHDQGMSMTFYANWWGGGGPPVMEMIRQHPDWFAIANYQTHIIDDWDLIGYHENMKDKKVRAPGVEWCFAPMSLIPFDGPLTSTLRKSSAPTECLSGMPSAMTRPTAGAGTCAALG